MIDQDKFWMTANDKICFYNNDISGLFQEDFDKWEAIDSPKLMDEKMEFILRHLIELCCSFDLKELGYLFSNFYLINEYKSDYDYAYYFAGHIRFFYEKYELAMECYDSLSEHTRVNALRPDEKSYYKENPIGVTDIVGMVMEELESTELSPAEYSQLLTEFDSVTYEWIRLPLPKSEQSESKKLIRKVVALCLKFHAVKTANLLAPLLFACDKEKEYFWQNTCMVGRIAYELSYHNIAKECFHFADVLSEHSCWKEEENQKYEGVLKEDSRLVLTDDMIKHNDQFTSDYENGKYKLYSAIESIRYKRKHDIFKPEAVNGLDKKKAKMEECKQKALTLCETRNTLSGKEYLKVLTDCLKLLKGNVYEYDVASYFYYLTGNYYLENNQIEKAEESYQNALKCKNGNQNTMVLCGNAKVYCLLNQKEKAELYLFRAYVLEGKEFLEKEEKELYDSLLKERILRIEG